MDLQRELDQALTAAQNKDFVTARTLLRQILEQDSHNVSAWLLFARVAQKKEHAIQCLERVLALDPGNRVALGMLERLSETGNIPASQPASGAHAKDLDHSDFPPSESKPSHIDQLRSESHTFLDSSMNTGNQESVLDPIGNTSTQSKPRAPFWWGIGFLLVCCLISGSAVAISQVSSGGTLVATRVPTPTSTELFEIIHTNLRAANAEDPLGYMATIHSESPSFVETEDLLRKSFYEFDLSYSVTDLEIIQQSRSEAKIHFLLTTRKIRGPDFRDNIVEGVFIMRPEKGVWKIYDQEVINLQYLN